MAKPRLLIHFGYDLRLVVASTLTLTPMMDKNKDIIGFARVDVIDGPTGTHIKVRE